MRLLLTIPTVVAAAQAAAQIGPLGAISVQLTGAESPAHVRQKLIETVSAETRALNDVALAYWQSRIARGLAREGQPFIAPRVAILKDPEGNVLWANSGASTHPQGGAPITLVFEGFDSIPVYRQLLQDTFDAARPTMDALFGQPYVGGVVKVVNMDATIGDRDAVAGGIYLPNDGTGSQAIWFAVYLAPETAVVNFIHCLYLAYQGPAMFAYDAWSEGFARAATMQTVRLGALPPGLDPEVLQQVVENTYDNSAHYSWHNQPPLGNNRFIAPNLRNLPLPPGGSLGGMYLMRYRQAGTAWAKVFVEYPGFFATFLQEYYDAYDADPTIAGDVPALKAMAQAVLNSLRGMPNATIEGRLFADWYRRQYVLDTSVTRGRKMYVESIPITTGLFGSDFGVFAFWGTYFETLAGGNEVLLSGTCYPIYWDSTFARMFTGGQDDRMDIAASFGSVTPNLPAVFGSGNPTQWYKATVELPVGDAIARTIVPAGAIATAAQPTPKNFYGTVMGFNGAVTGGNPNISGIVRLFLPGQDPVDAPLRNGAFGANVPAPGFNAPKLATVRVIRVESGAETVLLEIFVNTWGSALALDIRLEDERVFTPTGGLAGGVQMVGFPVRPYETDAATLLGLAPAQTLKARWQQNLFRYILYPSTSPFDLGYGFFLRLPANRPVFSVFGASAGPQPASVALQVGWNQVVNPFDSNVHISQVTVQRAAEAPRTFSSAVSAGWIEGSIFGFEPGPADPYSGLPETGTMMPMAAFPAGKAVFVRALVPEGVTITFPNPGTTLSGLASPPAAPPAWTAKLDIFSQGEKTSVEIGAKRGTRPGYDVGSDCLLPPAFAAGLQASIAAGEAPLFRDLRPGGLQTWTIVATGLTPGKVYELRFDLTSLRGLRPTGTISDVEGKRSVQLASGRRYIFTAATTTRTFRITARTLGLPK